MKKCKRCGNKMPVLTEEDNQEFEIYQDDDLCEDCLDELDEFSNTCPIHRTHNPDSFCEECLYEELENIGKMNERNEKRKRTD